MLTVVRRLCGHPVAGPSGVFDQSIDRIKFPISPPPRRKAKGSESEVSLSGRFMGTPSRTGLRYSFVVIRLSSTAFCTSFLSALPDFCGSKEMTLKLLWLDAANAERASAQEMTLECRFVVRTTRSRSSLTAVVGQLGDHVKRLLQGLAMNLRSRPIAC